MLKISITFFLVTVFYTISFIKNRVLYESLYDINDIFNKTARAESLYNMAINIEREKLINDKFTIDKTTGIKIVNKTIAECLYLNSEIILV